MMLLTVTPKLATSLARVRAKPVTAARRSCKALRQRWHDVPILVGLWNTSGDRGRPRQRLEAVGASEVATTFAECIALLEIQFSNGKRAVQLTTDRAEAATT